MPDVTNTHAQNCCGIPRNYFAEGARAMLEALTLDDGLGRRMVPSHLGDALALPSVRDLLAQHVVGTVSRLFVERIGGEIVEITPPEGGPYG